VRLCIAYEALFPYTIGGAERWLRRLAELLARRGHEVTYLTPRRWPPEDEPRVEGVRVVGIGGGGELYGGERRRIGPILRFNIGLFWHLLRRGRDYDVVQVTGLHLAPLLGAAARGRGRYRLVALWFEVWTREYWREYLGTVLGAAAWLVQRASLRAAQQVLCLADLHARRVRAEGFRGPVTRVGGVYWESANGRDARAPEPLVVYAGRHIPEKRVPALVRAFAAARRRRPELRCEVFGDGPDRAEVEQLVHRLGLDGAVIIPGFVPAERVQDALARAACLALPSRREGYGLVVVEAAALGTPSVVVRGDDNAALELVEDGINGIVADSAAPEELAAALERACDGGSALRESTARWFERNAERLSLAGTIDAIEAAYRGE
jgi:glycosyltransferase involved in cell wall biosynthesis